MSCDFKNTRTTIHSTFKINKQFKVFGTRQKHHRLINYNYKIYKHLTVNLLVMNFLFQLIKKKVFKLLSDK